MALNSFLRLLRRRRSVRRYRKQPIGPAALRLLQEAVLRAPSSRGLNPWEFVFVTDRAALRKLAAAKPHGSEFLAGAALGIVVCGDPRRADTWIEDGSIASMLAHLAAASLGLGSCWIQIRMRPHGAAESADAYVRRLLGGPGYVPPSGKVNIAFIGTGSQGLRVMFNFLRQEDVHGIAVCDPNMQSSDYPQWGHNEFCTSVRKLLGTDSGWEWLSPNDLIDLTRTVKATAGTCGREPARKIVEAYYAKQREAGQYKGCAAYSDFRELLEKEKDADAVVVGAGDHWHAFIAVAAMRKGKHVYGQKPMTRTVYEARRMAEVARETGVATQVAVVNQASEDTRVLCEYVWGGAIGTVRQVINWSSRPFWPQGIDRPKETPAVPKGLDWDLWLGPSPERPFHNIYHPFNWRGWHDFGGGAIGDMGCYSFDTIFRVLKLEAPSTVEASSSEAVAEAYPKACAMHFAFPARGDLPPVKVTWYDGGLKPPRPEDFGAKDKMRAEGLLFIGDKGSMLCGFNGSNPVLLPESRRKEFDPPPKTLPRSPGHDREWIEACKGGKPAPGANFVFTGPVTETIMLGNAALRTGERLAWDRENLKAANAPAAQKIIRPEYRPGWSL